MEVLVLCILWGLVAGFIGMKLDWHIVYTMMLGGFGGLIIGMLT